MKEKLKMPDGWHEITLSQFQEISLLDDKSETYAVDIVSIILDKDPEEIKSYSVDSSNKIMKHLEWCMKNPSDKEYKQYLDIDGVTYKLLENLNIFSGGEWWDMEEYIKDLNKNLHKLFALVYRPVGIEWNFKVRKESEKILQEKSMIGDLYGSTVFFCNVAQKSMTTIQDYLSKNLIQNTKMN